ncbi:hypothetical protein Tco_0491606 [Tanacetum coccineum]
MAYTSSRSSLISDNEVYDDSFCSKSCRKNTENLNNKIIKLNEELSDCETDLYNYKRGLSQVEARLVEFKNNEIKFCERIRVLERDLELRDNKIENLRNELEEVKKEKERIDFKIEKFDNAAKDLDCLLGTQRSVKDKTGLGLNEYIAVPPPPAQVYSPPKNDLSWTGFSEFIDDTVTDYSRPTPSIDVSKDISNEQKAIWKSNSVSFSEQGGSVGNVVSKPMIRKPTLKYAEMYKSQRPRGNQRNWNNQKSQQLGSDFVMIKKACSNVSTAIVTAIEKDPTAEVLTTARDTTPYTRRPRASREIERDAEIARIHAEEDLRQMINELDRSNVMINKHMAEYEEAENDLTIEEKTELITELINYQKDFANIKKYQAQQQRLASKSERRKFYTSVLRSHAGWKTKDFRGMTFDQLEEKFIPVWESIQDFIRYMHDLVNLICDNHFSLSTLITNCENFNYHGTT